MQAHYSTHVVWLLGSAIEDFFELLRQYVGACRDRPLFPAVVEIGQDNVQVVGSRIYDLRVLEEKLVGSFSLRGRRYFREVGQQLVDRLIPSAGPLTIPLSNACAENARSCSESRRRASGVQLQTWVNASNCLSKPDNKGTTAWL